jgi:hypothetical protein
MSSAFHFNNDDESASSTLPLLILESGPPSGLFNKREIFGDATEPGLLFNGGVR